MTLHVWAKLKSPLGMKLGYTCDLCDCEVDDHDLYGCDTGNPVALVKCLILRDSTRIWWEPVPDICEDTTALLIHHE